MRGITALTQAGVEQEILRTLIPMKGRMIHNLDGSLVSQPYGLHGECIHSVDRKLMNDHLLTAAEQRGVSLFFEHDVKSIDFDQGNILFSTYFLYHSIMFIHFHFDLYRPSGEKKVQADFIMGADGAYSSVRSLLMRKVRMDYQQSYIDHAWCELSILPSSDGKAKMDGHHLHIWPRKTFMMIALPNLVYPLSQFISNNGD